MTPSLTSEAPEAPAVAPDAIPDEEAAQNAQSQVLGSLNGPERDELSAQRAAIHGQLELVAARIEARCAEVSREWRERVSADTLLASSPAWSRRQFEDHMPEVILVLCKKMRSWPDVASLHEEEQHGARAHSQHRWQQGYDVRSLAREWGHLNAALLYALDCEWSNPSGPSQEQALRVARSIVAEIILESTSESVSSYSRLLQAEAAARMGHMEEVIEGLREQERTRGQMLREAAHDLRGSLGIVTGSASIIDRDQMDSGDRAEVGRLLRRGVSSLHEMMTDLIDLARLEAGQEGVANRLFDAAEVLRELGATALPLAQAKGLSLELEGPPTLSAWGDVGKVRRIAQNLLLNAIKYTHQGGVRLAWAPDGDDRWLLLVSDTGPGLGRSPAQPLAEAIEAATATARKIEGRTEGEQNPTGTRRAETRDGDASAHGRRSGEPRADPAAMKAAGEGVGLAIVKRLCDLLGAGLELEAGQGAGSTSGSTFRVLFARSPAVASATQRPPENVRLDGSEPVPVPEE